MSRKTNIKHLRGTGDFRRTLVSWDSSRGEWFFVAGGVSVSISRLLHIFVRVFDGVRVSGVHRTAVQLVNNFT